MKVESEKLSVEKAPELIYFSSLLPALSSVSPSSTILPTIPLFASIQSTDDMPLTVRSTYH